jgi:FtsP/CotA-like multicopper oxidase with cupredoxin domain
MLLSRFALALLGTCFSTVRAQTPTQTSTSPSLDVHETLYSQDGLLELTLSIGPALYQNDQGLEQYLVGYNGTVGGPTLYVKPGDVLRVTLINSLIKEPCNTFVPELFNAYHAVDKTNLHFHGLHIPASENPSKLIVDVGESHTYSFTIPEDHMGGTHWYHPHMAGSNTLQAGGGAVGMLIVQDLPGDIPEEIRNLPELNLRVQFLNMTYLRYDYSTGTDGSYVEMCRQFCLPEENRDLCTVRAYKSQSTIQSIVDSFFCVLACFSLGILF